MELIRDTVERYRQIYREEPGIVVSAPGRVNLIGDHTDYNMGFVLPVAIDKKIIIAAGKRRDDMLYLHSVDLQESVSSQLSRITKDTSAQWSNYPRGVAHVFRKNGYTLSGANFCIRGTIPIGAGLSSSAALEVASAIVFIQLNNIPMPLLDIIRIAREAEADFVGVQCGIMDQFVSVMGKKDHALFLDCKTLQYRHVPFPSGAALLICDTLVSRELHRSLYNQRESECREAVAELAKYVSGITSLADVSMEEFKSVEEKMPPVLSRRSRHVISENDRVKGSVGAMVENDLPGLGSLMVKSHESLRDYFEVSSSELDAVVDIAVSSKGVYGARMTGAGFGGCAICLVSEDDVDDFVERLGAEYPLRTGRSMTIYLASPDDGASVIYPGESMVPHAITQNP